MNIGAPRDYFKGLQARIVGELEALDGQPFRRDEWSRPEGGGGIARVIEEGNVFERGGVNFSHVAGPSLPASATAARPDLANRAWEAIGVSLVLHPRNPYVPTVHMNVRVFAAHSPNPRGDDDRWWFGGGMDLTPYYGFAEDAVHFHRTCRDALAPFGDDVHAKYKRWCDEYFYLKHRREPRGVGGIFFDDLAEGGFDRCFALVRSVGDRFLEAYVPIVGEAQRNALHGARTRLPGVPARALRGVQSRLGPRTLFGLQSNGRTEAILMSLPADREVALRLESGARHARSAALLRFSGGEGLAGMKDQHLTETRVSSDAVFDGLLLHIRRDTVRLPDGTLAQREFVVHPGAALVVPVLPDGNLVAVRQFRYPVGEVFLEFPAGKIDPPESALATARRELAEEAGYEATTFTPLGRVYSVVGYSDEAIDFYMAKA
jgi:coproporphyrinogen III oxidase